MKDDLDPRKQLDKHGRRILNREVYFAGKDIIRQGDEGFRAYYIETGRVEILVDDDRHELKVSELGPGDVFGEMSLINQEPRSATVRATKDTTVSIISREELEGKIERIDDVAMRALIHVLAERLRGATKSQLDYYADLADFQDLIAGIVERVQKGVAEEKREEFSQDVRPLLDELQNVLEKYRG